MTGLPLGQAKRCEYGIWAATCGRWATTKRQRPNGGATWDVCDHHAAFLDRLRANIRDHAALLQRLKECEADE